MLYLTVSMTGAAVMMIELLGTRIVGPFYGVSLFVWSSLISVTMIALALGYFLGGLAADRLPGFRLSHAIALAGLFTAIIPLISSPVLMATNELGVRGGAFSSALILFMVPLTFLGMVGPGVIKQASQRLEAVGMASGSVYAISTVGSVIGTLLLGFFLLPVVGSRAIVYCVSAALLLLAFALSVVESRRERHSPVRAGVWMIALICGGFYLFAALPSRAAHPTGTNVRFEKESLYGWVRVIDDPKEGIRWMLSDSSTISGAFTDTGESVLGYQYVVKDAVATLHPRARKALLIGLGGGHLSAMLGRRGVRTDVIEIDPVVVSAARSFYGFEPTGKVIVGDARYQVKQLKERYDLIIHDCFTGGSEPAHLLSIEMLRDLEKLLQPNGVLVLNFVGFTGGKESVAVVSVFRTIGEVFDHRRSYVSAPGERFNDFVLLASNAPFRADAHGENRQIDARLSRYEYPLADAGIVITDDFNPFEHMQYRKAERYRADLVKRVGTQTLLWQ